jgi:dipeptidyl aminopeptidase/acylaminoacyl peptidase
MRNFRSIIVAIITTVFAVASFGADSASDKQTKFTYQKPPKVIKDILESPANPTVDISPTRDRLLIVNSMRHPFVADLAQPMLRIGGLRINPMTNGRHHPTRHVGLTLLDIKSGKETKVVVPANPLLSVPIWSPDGRHFAFTNTTKNSTDLWLGNSATGAVTKVAGIKINSSFREASQWISDSSALLVQTVPATRGLPPAEVKVPEGPNVQESAGKPAPIRTYEDLLQNRHDEDLFDYYVTSQLAIVDVASAKVTNIGKPAIFAGIDPSPDGAHILISRIVRPYSYLSPATEFPKEVEVWDRNGKIEHKVASQPLAEQVPIEGVLTGPRDAEWIATKPATLAWVEALDGGNPKTKADFRDQVYTLSAPFSGKPTELVKLKFRFTGGGGFGGGGRASAIACGDKGLALIHDYDRNRRWVRTLAINIDEPGKEPRVINERSIRDRYGDPGTPVLKTLANGKRVLDQHGDEIYLIGQGASAKGEFPFLDRFNLATLKSERIFKAADKTYELPVALLSNDGSRFLTRLETPEMPPNYYIREALMSDSKTQITKFPDPAPALKGITKQLVTYKRADGVQLSFTLYLPAGYRQGERLPTIVWAYPLEFNDADTAGQVSGSEYRFTTIGGISQLFLVTQGYAVLDNATMPVIGDPETMNNTYVEQVVASAKAAIDRAVEMGVTDRDRVGVGGHSYGAFMTANLLAHSDLFRAGVARSGAYNRTLTPFGFQSERRTYWEAPDMYMKVSPFAYADKIKTPILLIHGEADDNSGTFPIQSERMYQAIKGNGGTIRYVTLPYEAHGYLGLESTEHVQWEMINWFDKWVKNAAPKAKNGEAAGN